MCPPTVVCDAHDAPGRLSLRTDRVRHHLWFVPREPLRLATPEADVATCPFDTGRGAVRRAGPLRRSMALPLLANVDVDDLARGVEFYCAALGLRVGRRLDGIGAVELLGATSPVFILDRPAGSPAAPGADAPRDYRRHWTPVHLEFVVERIGPAVERARAAGARLEGEVSTHAWGRLAVFADPFGNGFCLIEFTGRGYDAIAT